MLILPTNFPEEPKVLIIHSQCLSYVTTRIKGSGLKSDQLSAE